MNQNIDLNDYYYWQNENALIQTLIKKRVSENPDKAALIDRNKIITYKQLDEITDNMALYLREYGITDRSYAGIFMNRSSEYILSCLAVLKAGAAYIPLELAYPRNLLAQIFDSAKPKLVLTKNNFQPILEDFDFFKISVDEIETLKKYDNSGLDKIKTNANDAAILGYTSGTTGKPKGVIVSQRATLYAHAKFWQEIQNCGETDKFAFTTFIAWDAVSPFQYGATGYIVPEEYSYDTRYMADFIEEQQINHTVMTPSLLSSLLNTLDAETIRKKLKTLNVLWIGGEVSTPALADRILKILPNLNLINNYGPVECFVITQGKLRYNDSASPDYCPVGKVLEYMNVKLLDENMNEVISGETGELYATGPCLADGYIDNEELTKKKFVNINDQRFYKTEDMAYFLDDGRLVVKGRIDSVVKLRGYHINLKSIEENLMKYNKIVDCVALTAGDKSQSEFIAAFIIKRENAEIIIDKKSGYCAELVTHLKNFLPEYMLPSVFIEISELPIDKTSGKLDRKKILKLVPVRQKKNIEFPANIQEKSLAEQTNFVCRAAECVIGLEAGSIQRDTNLFDIGLHSLLAVELASTIEKVFDKKIMVEHLYQNSSAAELIEFLNAFEKKKVLNLQDETVFSYPHITNKTFYTRSVKNSKNILLTGATGFLGVYVLAELLKHTTANIYCIVRGESPEIRIKEKLNVYKLQYPEFEKKIIALSGDISEENFGLNKKIYAELCRVIDTVFHSAAMVNMIYPYKLLKKNNVESVKNIINFSMTKKLKKINYISTLGIFPAEQSVICRENFEIDEYAQMLTNGYTQSKWVAEKLVINAIKEGLPALIFRPGNISADTNTFLANPNDAQVLILDACRKIKAAPLNDNWLFESTPVNFISEIIYAAAADEKIDSMVFNIAAEKTFPANVVFKRMFDLKQIDEYLTLTEWKKRLSFYSENNGYAKARITAENIDFEVDYMRIDSIIEMNNTKKIIIENNIVEKKSTPEILINSKSVNEW